MLVQPHSGGSSSMLMVFWRKTTSRMSDWRPGYKYNIRLEVRLADQCSMIRCSSHSRDVYRSLTLGTWHHCGTHVVHWTIWGEDCSNIVRLECHFADADDTKTPDGWAVSVRLVADSKDGNRWSVEVHAGRRQINRIEKLDEGWPIKIRCFVFPSHDKHSFECRPWK